MERREREERETRKHLYSRFTYTPVRKWLNLKGRIVLSANIPREDADIINKLEEIANRERVTVSKIIYRAIKEYVERHKDGGHQNLLTRETRPLYVNPVLEQRRDILAELLYEIKKTEGRPVPQVIADFARIHGLRVKTVRQMVHDLKLAGKW